MRPQLVCLCFPVLPFQGTVSERACPTKLRRINGKELVNLLHLFPNCQQDLNSFFYYKRGSLQ